MEKILKFTLKEVVKKIKDLDKYAKTQEEGNANLADFCKKLSETFDIEVKAEIKNGFACFDFLWGFNTFEVDTYIEPCWTTKPTSELF